MALITFEDLPSTNTPLNAANLNNNFNALNTIVGTTANAKGCVKIGKIGIEWGTVSVEPSSGTSPNYYGSETVYFVNTYKYNPSMIACGGAGYTSVLNVTTINIGKTSGDVWMSASSQTSRTCRYLVIGEIE